MNRKQEYKIKTFFKKFLNGKIPLNDAQYRKLSKHKNFIRSLSSENFKVRNLMRNNNALGEIINLMVTLSKNESHTKNDTSTFQGMVEIASPKYYEQKGKKCNKNKSRRKEEKETDDSSEEDFSESESYTETSNSDKEEEMEEGEETNSDCKSSECNEKEEIENREEVYERERD